MLRPKIWVTSALSEPGDLPGDLASAVEQVGGSSTASSTAAVTPELRTLAAQDGLKISGWLYRPARRRPAAPFLR